MSCKIIDIRTGEEWKRPGACLRRRPAKLLTATGMSRQAGENSFTNAGEIALRDILPDLKRRMPR